MATLIVTLLTTKTASAVYTDIGSSCVRNGVCYYTSVTDYASVRSYAVGEWNSLSDGTPKHFAYNEFSPRRDLHVEDYFADDGSDGIYSWNSGGLDYIRFNKRNMSSDTAAQNRAVGVHEFGHSLRLGHPSGKNESPYWRDRSIMYFMPEACPFSTYRSYDIGEYRGIW